jgi:chromosome segregation ATPase
MPRETSAANAQTRIIERDLANLSSRFDRHLEIYSQNGKEFIALKAAVDNLRSTIENSNRSYDGDLNNIRGEFKEYVSKVNGLELNLSSLATKIGMYATIGSAIASTAVSIGLRVFFY